MERLLILICLGLGLFLADVRPAEAQEWIICSNCTTDSQFQAAALARTPNRTGEYSYAVGNPNTGVMKYAYVFRTLPGEIPRSVTEPKTTMLSLELQAQGSVGFITNEEPAVTVSEDPKELANLIQAFGGSENAFVYDASAADQQQFGAIVNVSRNSVLVTAPNGYGFESFHGAQMEMVSPFLYSAMAAGANPAWQAAEIPSLWKGLFNALKSLHGKGPTACIIYNNGDSACYQMNILDKNAALYITDSAKDADGNLIPTAGGIGSGGGLNVGPNLPSLGFITWSRGSSAYLICSYVGGKLHSCYVENP